MRTSGMLLMDTPVPDGRIFIGPQKWLIGGTTIQAVTNDGSGLYNIPWNNTNGSLVGIPSEEMIRFGMSDDAQQQFGQGSPSGGYQGAQAQAISSTTPFTTPYGPSGRPPVAAANLFIPPTSRPKGFMPQALTVAYSISGAAATGFNASLIKTTFAAGAAPLVTTLIPLTAVALAVSTFVLARLAVPANAQAFLTSFDMLSVALQLNTGASSTIKLYGAYIDGSINYN